MMDEECIKNLEYLINKYISKKIKQAELINEIHKRDFYIARSVLHEITKSSKTIEESDSLLIRKISSNYA